MYTRIWTDLRASNATEADEIDEKINQLSVDISERMADVLGNTNWASGADPVVAAASSLAALFTAVAGKATINSTNNKLAKRTDASTLGDSNITDDGSLVTIASKIQQSVGVFGSATQPRFSVKRTTSQTILPSANNNITFDTEVVDVGGCFNTSVFSVPVGAEGLWLVGFTITPHFFGSTWGFNAPFLAKLTGSFESAYVTNTEAAINGHLHPSSVSYVGLYNMPVAGGFWVNVANIHLVNTLTIGAGAEFWGVKLF